MTTLARRLRRRIAGSETLNHGLACLISSYIRYVFRTTTWQRIGFKELDDLAEAGEAVIVVLWHQRLLMTPYFFPLHIARAGTITSAARAGSVAGRVHRHFGLQNVAMESGTSNFQASRRVARLLRDGVTMGFAADGPNGPARVASLSPVYWAQMSGKRVFLISYSVRDAWKARSWDRLLIPRPYTDGVLVCREWTTKVPRKAEPTELEAYRQNLQSDLDAVTAEADEIISDPYARAQTA